MEKLCVLVANNYESASREAAAVCLRSVACRSSILLCAATGSSPGRLYELLSPLATTLPASLSTDCRVRVCKLDEWAGLSETHPASCSFYIRSHVLPALSVQENDFVDHPRGDAIDIAAELVATDKWLENNGPIDLCILGLGANGHVGLNEPADTWAPAGTHQVSLEASSRNHQMLHDLSEERRPTKGYTLGRRAILGSKTVVMIVSGRAKRSALNALLAAPGSVYPRIPASMLWGHPDATIVCDMDAIGEQEFHELQRRCQDSKFLDVVARIP